MTRCKYPQDRCRSVADCSCMHDVQVVYVEDGRGLCVICGNGLWPGQEPCEHKIANAERRAREAAALGSKRRYEEDR